MTAIDSALPRIKTEEGFRAHIYTDSQGHPTIGYGFNVDAGISQRAAAALLTEQLQELHEMLARYSWYAGLDPIRQGVCLDIAFNDGLHGLLQFAKAIAALAKKDWETAAAEILDSNAARELPGRYGTLAQILRTGTEEVSA